MREDIMDTFWTRRTKVFRVLIAGLFVATMLLSFSWNAAYASGEVTHCIIDAGVHNLGNGEDLWAYKIRYIETRNGFILNCYFNYSNLDPDDFSWPGSGRVEMDFPCFVNSFVATKSRAVIKTNGEISMTCLFTDVGE